MTTFHIIDAPTGAGKTTAIINYLKNTQHNFILITPYLTEVKRLEDSLSECNCFVPNDDTSKKQQVLTAIQEGRNIITTHKLFTDNEVEIADTVKDTQTQYILVCDEEYPCFDSVHKAGSEDYPSLAEYQLLLKAGMIEEDEKHLITWLSNDRFNLYEKFREYCINKDVYYYNNAFLIFTKQSIWCNFYKVMILSYRVKHSSFGYYCNLHNFNLMYYHIKHTQIREGYKEQYPKGITRIELDDSYILENEYALSKAWYAKPSNTQEIKQLKKKMNTFLRKHDTDLRLWCTFKTYVSSFTDKNISEKAFISCNTKATNDYKDKTVLAYLVNRYMNPIVKSFLDTQNVNTDIEQWALNEMIQLVWRTNLRDTQRNNTVHLFIPSSRMKNLLLQWMKDSKENKL